MQTIEYDSDIKEKNSLLIHARTWMHLKWSFLSARMQVFMFHPGKDEATGEEIGNACLGLRARRAADHK